jgi:hypothetical protein
MGVIQQILLVRHAKILISMKGRFDLIKQQYAQNR